MMLFIECVEEVKFPKKFGFTQVRNVVLGLIPLYVIAIVVTARARMNSTSFCSSYTKNKPASYQLHTGWRSIPKTPTIPSTINIG
jgi:hypothetical protein